MKKQFGYLPVSLFGSVMGLTGLSVSWANFSSLYEFGWAGLVAGAIAIIAVVCFVALLVTYGLKIITNFDVVKQEFSNSLSRGFFGTFIIALLLLPLIIYDYAPKIALFVWVLGAVLMLVFAVHIVNFWLSSAQDLKAITPAWIIPVVGTLDIPLATHLFDFSGAYYLNVLSLALGLFFTIPIVTLIFARLFFFEKLPQKLEPSLMILVAPFSVGFLAYHTIDTSLNAFSLGLFFLGIFVFLSVLPQLGKLSVCCPFKTTWWAVSFPLAAMLNSCLVVAKGLENTAFDALAIIIFIFVNGVFLWIGSITLKAILKGELEKLS